MNLTPNPQNSFSRNFKTVTIVSITALCAVFFYNPINSPAESQEALIEEINYIPDDDPSRARDHEGDTFSIVAYDPVTGQIGGAACSCYSGTIDFLSEPVRHPSTGVLLGAIHTQAAYTSCNQDRARTRMEAGDTPAQIISYMQSNDCGSGPGTRQYGIVGIDSGGNITTAGYTGSSNGFWAGDIQGIDAATGMHYSIQGNILDTSTAGSGRQDILDDMEAAFINTTGTLADKLMAALQGAKRVGADNRCTNSGMSGRAAFVKVLYPTDPNDNSPTIDISLYPNISWIEPIDELQCAYDSAYPPPTCRGTVNTYPYTMDFEEYMWIKDENNCSPSNATNSWIRSRHSTPTASTGPTGANQGQLYMFVEANQGTNDSAQMTSPCFEIPSSQTTLINFDYHMWGTNMGSLDLSVNAGSGWTSLWSLSGNQGNSWNNQQVDLSAYAGSTIRLRFNGTTGGGDTSDMALDDIVITSAPTFCASTGNTTTNKGITNVNINTINNSDGPGKDVGYEDFTGISTDLEQGVSYDLNVSVNTDGNNTVFAKAWIDWNNDSDFSDPGEEYDLGSATNTSSGTTSLSPLSIAVSGSESLGTKRMRVSAKNNSAPTSCETGFDGEVEDYTLNIIPPIVLVSCTNTVDVFDYSEGFEGDIGLWEQASGDDGDWILFSGSTPSGNTGPSSANEGTNYLYIEASTNGTTGEIGSNATAILESPCFDLTYAQGADFTFDYHSWGANTGTISLQVSEIEGVWSEIFNVTGVNNNAWVPTTVSLDAYKGKSIKLRFVGTTGNGWASDLAVDNTALTLNCPASSEYTGGSWVGGTPTIGNEVTITDNYTTASDGGSIDACQVTIGAGATLRISQGDYLNVNGDITVNGTLIIEHQGVVVQADPNATVSNNGTINVELSTPPLKQRDFMVMGSPMTTETRTGVFTNAYNVQEYTSGNFIPHPGIPAGGTNFLDDDQNAWNPASGSITPGEGYLVYPQASYNDPAYGGDPLATIVFDMTYTQGTLNNGTVTRPITFNGLGSNPDGTPNVLANPYASPIDASALVADNALINEVYFWEHLTTPNSGIPGPQTNNFSMDDISMYNGTMGVPAANDPGTSTMPNGVISTGQGFGIKAFGAGSIDFNNSMRLTSGNTTLRTPEGLEKLVLKVRNEQYELGSYTGIGFRPDGTAQLDDNMDSNRLATVVSLYSHLEDGSEQLGIQTRESFDDEIKIPMGFASQVEEEATYVISIAGLEGSILPNTTIYLVDNQENIITDLTQDNYEFKSNKGTFNGRFTLQFEEENILGQTTSTLDSISVYPNPTEDILNIHSNGILMNTIRIFDVRGRSMAQQIVNNQNTVMLDISSYPSGVYFVRIETEAEIITKKIIKK